jgi:hypothetical protein
MLLKVRESFLLEKIIVPTNGGVDDHRVIEGRPNPQPVLSGPNLNVTG